MIVYGESVPKHDFRVSVMSLPDIYYRTEGEFEFQVPYLCAQLGIAMTIEDSWGGDIITAAISHFAHSNPPELLFTSTDFNSYVTKSIATGAPQRDHGRLRASTQPGLGIEPRMEVLGTPVWSSDAD